MEAAQSKELAEILTLAMSVSVEHQVQAAAALAKLSANAEAAEAVLASRALAQLLRQSVTQPRLTPLLALAAFSLSDRLATASEPQQERKLAQTPRPLALMNRRSSDSENKEEEQAEVRAPRRLRTMRWPSQ
eukprot:3207831-Pleurochrysis_carterae.AAC.2